MNNIIKRNFWLVAFLGLLLAMLVAAQQAKLVSINAAGTTNTIPIEPITMPPPTSITSLGTAFTENFDSMAFSGTATIPSGFVVGTDWSTGTTATNFAYGTTGAGVVTGTSTGGAINWANGVTASATDRSLGFLNTGTFTSPQSIVLKMTNNSGATITSLAIAFAYEKSRSGSRQFDWTFFHGDTSTPSTSAAAGDQTYAADANNTTISNPPVTTNKSVNLAGLSIADGSDYYLKWTFTGLAGSTNGQGIGLDNFSVVASGVAPEMNVTVSGATIPDGFIPPTGNNLTDFSYTLVSSGTQSRTFTIANSGETALNLTGVPLVAISGANASDFSVTVDPVTPVSGAGGTTTFTVVFDPSAAGTRTATISIANDDSNENPYDFAVQGTGLAAPITKTWFGSTSTNWNTGSNWSGGTVPVATDDVLIPNTTNKPLASSLTYTVRNLTINSGAILTVDFSGDLVINGDFTINAGATASIVNQNSTYRFAGANFVNNGTVFAGDWEFAGTGVQNWSGAGTFAMSELTGLTINSGAIPTLGSDITLSKFTVANSVFFIDPGATLDVGTNTLTLNSVTLTNSGTVTGGSGKLRTQGSAVFTGVGPYNSAIEVHNGTTTSGTTTLSGTLTILSGATLTHTFGTTVTCNGDFTINAGGAYSPFNQTSTFQFGGANFVNNGTVSNGQFEFAGSGVQNWSGTGSFSPASLTGIFINSGSIATLANNVTITGGTFTVNSGGTFAIDIKMLTLSAVLFRNFGTVTGTGAGKLRTQGTTTLDVDGATNIGTFSAPLEVFSGTTTVDTSTFGGSITILTTAILSQSFGITVICNGDFTIDAGGAYNPNNQTSTFRFGGANFVNNGAITNGRFEFGRTGAQNWSGTGTFTPNSLAGIFVNTGSITTLTSNVAVTSGPFTVNSGGTLFCGVSSMTGGGSFTLASGGTLGIGSPSGITSSGAIGNIQVTGARSFNTGANYIYNGSSAQVTGNGFPATVNQLTIDNSTGVTLTGSVSIASALFLTSGNLTTTGANTLIMDAAAAAMRTTGYIIGNERRIFNAAGSFTFDVGTASGYSPATINIDSSTIFPTNFTVTANPGILAGTAPFSTLQRYWTLTPGTGITQGDITFQYVQADVPPQATESQFVFTRRTGGSNQSFPPTSFNTTTNIFTLNDVTTFSDWTLEDLAPTAASVLLGGRVLSADGRGVSKARVTLIESSGATRVSLTNPFGYYRFDDVSVGQTVVISVDSKLFIFEPDSMVINVTETMENLNFIAGP